MKETMQDRKTMVWASQSLSYPSQNHKKNMLLALILKIITCSLLNIVEKIQKE